VSLIAINGPLGVPVGILPKRLILKKIEWCGYRVVKNFEDMFTHCDRIHEGGGRTDRRTDGHRTTA